MTRRISRAMLETVRKYIAKGGPTGDGHVFMVQDLTFKMTASGFGLAALCLPYMRFDNDHGGQWVTSSLIAGLGWGPKDDESSWSVILMSLLS